VGTIQEVAGGLVRGVVESETQASVAVAELPLTTNPALRHDAAGVLGLAGPNAFYLTLGPNPELDRRYTALGKVIAGQPSLARMTAGDEILRIRILRAGADAQAFATDDAAFQRLLDAARRR
jgi:cyclophilin family peptidyl-prolyl cis-trans isomerase